MPLTAGGNDVWGQAVNLFTGYPMPDRSTIFDKISSDPDKIPLFRMDIQYVPGGLNNSGGVSQGSGAPAPVYAEDFTAFRAIHDNQWLPNGETYDLPFYIRGKNNAELHKARIVFIGVPLDPKTGREDLMDDGQMSTGGPFKGPTSGTDWDTGPMAQYISGAKAALDALANDHTTYNFAYSGATVAHEDSVDLNIFDQIAKSFDRATKFFVDHGKTLASWEKAMGGENSAWQGQAAGVFQSLLHNLNKNYASYVDQLGGENYAASNSTINGYTPQSKYADSMAQAQKNLFDQVQNLRTAWGNWATGYGSHWPHRWLLTVLDELTAWVVDNNASQVLQDGGVTPQFTSVHPTYGDLANVQNWKAVGQDAVQRWNNHVEQVLVPVAGQALTTLKRNWVDASENFAQPLETKNTESLTDQFNADQAKKAQDDANKAQADANKKLNDTLGDISKGQKGLNDALGDSNKALNNFGDGVSDSLKGFGDGLNNALGGGGGGSGLLNNLLGGNGGGGGALNDLLGGGTGGGGGAGGLGPLNNLAGLTGPTGSGPGGGPGSSGGTGPLNDLTSSLLGGGPDGTGVNSVTNPDGSTTKLNADGSLSTTFPDGSTSVFNPATGMLNHLSPNGQSSTTNLGSKGSVTNPDGSTTKLNDDGTLTTTFPDGSSTTVDPSTGHVTSTNPDGSTSTSSLNPNLGSFSTPDGGNSHLNADGSLTTTFPDGSSQQINPGTGTVTTTGADGSTHTSHLGAGDSITNPDGSTTLLNPDGSLSTKFPDGTTQVLNPDGTLQTTNPDGTTSSTDLLNHDLNSNGPDTSGLDDALSHLNSLDTSGLDHTLSHLNNLSSSGLDHTLNHLNGLSSSGLDHTLNHLSDLGSGGGGLPDSSGMLNTGLSSGGPGHADSADFEDLNDPEFSGGSLGAPGPGAGAANGSLSGNPPGGTPLNPGLGGMGGGMGGGGMGGGGMGGAGGGDKGERVRTVHGDGDGAFVGRRLSRGQADEEGEDLAPLRRTATTSSSGAPGTAGSGARQGGRSTESSNQPRPNYVMEEEEDVWGSEDGGAPAVIG